MTATVTDERNTDELLVTVARHNPHRWRLHRAGFVDVWQYFDNEFDLSAGRGILRGPNGSGKSRALEMLLPFLLDADRRNMATATPVRLEDLMARGIGDRTVRQGQMWLELRRVDEDGVELFYTLGACLRYSATSRDVAAHYWTTDQRVGHELALKVDGVPLSRRDLMAAIGADRVVESASAHRDRVRVEVFGLTGESGKERFDGLLRLLHTLRAPSVGDRIESGALPQIVSQALPPLSENSLAGAGQALDNLTSTREDLERMRQAHASVETFLDVYRRWLTGTFASLFDDAGNAAARAIDDRAKAGELAGKAAALEKQIIAAKLEYDRHELASTEAAAQAETLKSSPRYQALTELGDKRQALTFAESAAHGALAAAHDLREVEASAANAANSAADNAKGELDELNSALAGAREAMAAASLHGHELPASVVLDRRPGAAQSDAVHLELDGGPVTLTRPAPDTIEVTVSLDEIAGAARAAENAADARRSGAAARASTAQRLEREQQQLAADQRAADSLATGADTAEGLADTAEADRDEAARALAHDWMAWTAHPNTVELLGPLDWAAIEPVAPLLAGVDLLVGDWVDEPVSLAQLAGAASVAAEPARLALADERARFDGAQRADDEREAQLTERRKRFTDHHDELPESPSWQSVAGTALWQVTDFVAELPASERAGVEAALAGAGALTATVDADGGLVASDGHLLISPGAAAVQPLSRWLEVDVAAATEHGIDPDVAARLLSSIGTSSDSSGTDAGAAPALVVGADGTWSNGPLRGRHPVTVAKHIGAAARAAERAARIEEIDRELTAIATARSDRREQTAALTTRASTLASHITTAPSSTEYMTARVGASTKRQVAFEARARADAEQAALMEKALVLRGERERHKQACDAADLPTDVHGLRSAEQDSATARNVCRAVPGALGRVTSALAAWAKLFEQVEARASRRAELEASAVTAWDAWRTARIEYRTLEEAVGDSGRDLHRLVEDLEARARSERKLAGTAATLHTTLTGKHGTAQAQASAAADTAAGSEQALTDAALAVRGKLALAGVVDTLYIDPNRAQHARDGFAYPAPAAVAADAVKLAAMLRRARTGDAQLHAEERTFAAVIGERFDLHPDLVEGIWLYQLSDSEGRRPLAAAAAQLQQRYEQGQATLTERDTAIFTDYLLGEVGDELRRRIGQAEALIADMQASLGTIRTSHDVQVKIRWGLDEDTGEDIRAIDKLARVAQPMRNREQGTELVRLLRERVMTEAAANPSAGFTEHLQNALDYRAWHRVEVLAHAPHLGATKVSGKSKLSQGELRTVSYVTLFAAVDAYVSSLADDRALRLALLDDAFAKVDANSIGQMMGLLVRLDIDFLLTGHDLWGCFSTVPTLDVYTILRQEDGPAVAQHTHWDGRSRHLRVP